MTFGWLILIIVIFLAVFALFSPTVGSTESEESVESEESRKRREHMEEIRKMFLSQNADFPDLILTKAFSEGSEKNPWILSVKKATSERVRTVFIGYEDMYVIRGISEVKYPLDSDILHGRWCTYAWPDTYRKPYLRIQYANDLCYTAIDDYQEVNKFFVLHWIAENIREKFQVLHPDMNVSEVDYSTSHYSRSDCYYYFTYEVPGIQLSGWK